MGRLPVLRQGVGTGGAASCGRPQAERGGIPGGSVSRKRRGESEGTTIEVGPVGVVVGLLVALGVAAAAVYFIRGALHPSGAGVPAPVPAQAQDPVPAATLEPGTWVTADGDPAIGAPGAPVSIVEYEDYQCGNCRQFTTEVVPWLRGSWLRDGFVNIVVRDFAIQGEDSVRAAEAAHCAAEQGRFWAYHDALFQAQPGPYDADSLVSIASALGLDADAFAACLSSGRYEASVEASTQAGHAQGFDGTPTYLINGRQVQGAIEIERWQALFEAFVADFAKATQSGAAP